MLERIPSTDRVTVGADKAYDTKDFVEECRNLNVTPHVAQNEKRPGGSAIDGRTTRHEGYAISQRKRKRIEEGFGWLKTLPCCGRCGTGESSRWAGCSRSRRQPIIWCECGIYWPAQLESHKYEG